MLEKNTLLDLYSKMLCIRAFDEKIAYFFSLGKVHGTTHLYVGEEATADRSVFSIKGTGLYYQYPQRTWARDRHGNGYEFDDGRNAG